MEFIDLHSIFKDNSVISFIPNYLIFQKIQSTALNITNQLGKLYFTLIKSVTDINIDSNFVTLNEVSRIFI